jgi:dienelactone hydrolase
VAEIVLFHHAWGRRRASSLPDYDEAAATLAKQRVFAFLKNAG